MPKEDMKAGREPAEKEGCEGMCVWWVIERNGVKMPKIHVLISCKKTVRNFKKLAVKSIV